MSRARELRDWAAGVLLEVILAVIAIGLGLWYLGWLEHP